MFNAQHQSAQHQSAQHQSAQHQSAQHQSAQHQSAQHQGAFMSLKPCLGRVLEALLPMLVDVQDALAGIHTRSVNPDEFLQRMSDLGVRVANIGEILRQYHRTFPLVARSAPRAEFRSYPEMRQNLTCILCKPQTFPAVVARYKVSHLFEWFIFTVVSLAWYRGRMTELSCDGPIMDCFAQLVWSLYCLKPAWPKKDADAGIKSLQVLHQDRPAYCLSVLHGLLLLTESSSFSGAPEIQADLCRVASEWFFQDHQKTVAFVTYNCLLNPLRIKEFGEPFDYKLLISQLSHEVQIMQQNNPDLQYCFFQEINDLFDITTRQQVAAALTDATGLEHTYYAVQHNISHVSSGTLTASTQAMDHKYAKAIDFPYLYTLPKSGDPIMVNDILFHGAKDMITDNIFIVTHHQDPVLGKLCCINVHLISGEDFNARHKRRYQLKIIKDYIDTIEANTAVVVMGDFNQVPDDTLDMLRTLHYAESYIASLGVVNRAMRFETHNGKRIDYCFHSQHIELVAAETCETHSFVSDHFPVIFRFRASI